MKKIKLAKGGKDLPFRIYSNKTVGIIEKVIFTNVTPRLKI